MPHIDARFRIGIRNWDKHQREMRGEGKRRRRRDWIALSTDICRDPDVLALTIEQRWLWVALLTHAGRVGWEFEISASNARVLFGLRPGWRPSNDFQVLEKHGFIELETVVAGEKPKPRKKPKPKPKDDPPPYPPGLNVKAWEEFMQYRRELNLKRYTETGAKRAMNKWAKHSPEQQAEALLRTMEQNYQGVFFDEKAKGSDSFDNIHSRVKTRAGLD